jgi:hypothetical protein
MNDNEITVVEEVVLDNGDTEVIFSNGDTMRFWADGDTITSNGNRFSKAALDSYAQEKKSAIPPMVDAEFFAFWIDPHRELN